MSRLREHLHQLDKGETSLVPPKREIINDLKRANGRRRSTWSNLSSSLTKEEEALYSVIVANFGERQKQLLAENATLRQSLARLLSSATNSRSEESRGEGDGEVDDDPTLRLPIHLINLDRIEEKISGADSPAGGASPPSKSHERRESHLHIVGSEESDLDKSSKEKRDRLSAKVEYYEETIERQARLIERLAIGNASDSAASTASSFSTSASSSVCCTCRPSKTTNLSLPASDLESEPDDRLSRGGLGLGTVLPLDIEATVIDKSVRSARTLRDSFVRESAVSPPGNSQSDGLLANYLFVSSTQPVAPSKSSPALSTIATGGKHTASSIATGGKLAAASIATGGKHAAASIAPASSSTSITLGANRIGSSGRSSITSISSLSRTNSTVDASDEAGAFV